ncbi:hypothetical protein GCM10027064_15640 [Microbacterium petrolearium]|jgi:hypothetical protein
MAGFFGRFVAGSGDTDDQGALCGFDDVVGDGVEFVDLQDPLDLGEEAFEEPEVAAGDPCDGCDGLGVGEVVGVEGLAEGSPVSLEDELNRPGFRSYRFPCPAVAGACDLG